MIVLDSMIEIDRVTCSSIVWQIRIRRLLVNSGRLCFGDRCCDTVVENQLWVYLASFAIPTQTRYLGTRRKQT